MEKNSLSQSNDYGKIEPVLFELLSIQTQKFLMNDSSSIKVEKAQELYSSICYSIKQYFENGGSVDFFINNPYDALKESQVILENKIQFAKKLFLSLKRCQFLKNHYAFNDTLKEIERGFLYYDYRYFADTFPAGITYWLSNSVSDDYVGIDYILQYLTYLNYELIFSSKFPCERVEKALKISYVDYNNLPLNTFDVILKNAFMLFIINKDVSQLTVSAQDKKKIKYLFSKIENQDFDNLVNGHLPDLLMQLGITDYEIELYIDKSLKNMKNLLISQ